MSNRIKSAMITQSAMKPADGPSLLGLRNPSPRPSSLVDGDGDALAELDAV